MFIRMATASHHYNCYAISPLPTLSDWYTKYMKFTMIEIRGLRSCLPYILLRSSMSTNGLYGWCTAGPFEVHLLNGTIQPLIEPHHISRASHHPSYQSRNIPNLLLSGARNLR